MFRSSYNSFGFSDSFRNGLTMEGFINWLHSLNTWPWVVLFCLILPMPLVVARRGQATAVPGTMGTVGLLSLMWVVDCWNNHNAFESWIGWALFIRLIILAMPVAAVWLGCLVAPCVYHLVTALKPGLPHGQPSSRAWSWRLVGIAALMTVLNMGAVMAGMTAVHWAKAHQQGPFWQGLGGAATIFLPAPRFFYFGCAQPIGGVLVPGWTLLVTLVAAVLPLRTGRWADGARALVIAFMLSGFIGLWIVGDVFINLDHTFLEVVAKGFMIP